MNSKQMKKVMAEKVRIGSKEVRSGDKKLVVKNYDCGLDGKSQLAGFHIVPQAELDFYEKYDSWARLGLVKAVLEDGETRNTFEPTVHDYRTPSWSIMFQTVYEMMTDEEYEEFASANKHMEVTKEQYACGLIYQTPLIKVA